jgi:hypothetical protein
MKLRVGPNKWDREQHVLLLSQKHVVCHLGVTLQRGQKTKFLKYEGVLPLAVTAAISDMLESLPTAACSSSTLYVSLSLFPKPISNKSRASIGVGRLTNSR